MAVRPQLIDSEQHKFIHSEEEEGMWSHIYPYVLLSQNDPKLIMYL